MITISTEYGLKDQQVLSSGAVVIYNNNIRWIADPVCLILTIITLPFLVPARQA